MERIEDKIRTVILRLLCAGMGAVIAVSAVCMLFMRKTSADTYKKMENQSVDTGVDILTEEISAQAEQYAVSCSDVIEKQFGQTALAMEVIAGGITDMYENPGRYDPAPCPHAHSVSGEGRQMHWLLPEGMAYEDETARELEILGNLEPYFRSISEENPQILHIFFAGVSGVNIGLDEDYEKKPDIFESRTRDWYINALNTGEMTVSDAYADSFRGEQVVTFSMPCYSGDGTLLGVLAVDLLIGDLTEMTEDIELEFDGYAMLVSQSGSVIAAPGAEEGEATAERFLGDRYEEIIDEMNKGGSGMQTSLIAGKEKYVIYSRIDAVGWDIIIVFDREAFVHAAQTRFEVLDATMLEGGTAISRQMLFTGGMWAAAVLLLLFAVSRASGRMAEKISAPVEQLTADVRKVGEGDLNYVHHIRTGDELETLSHTFESMTVSLKNHIRSLSQMSAERERLATELNVATQIQVSMLPCIFPAFPERRDIDIYASMAPAREVGGDFYDFFLTDENHLHVVMADVSGKGIPAALFMVVTKTLLKDNLSSGMPLEQVFARVNSQLCENNEAGMFVTVFAGCLDLRDGRFLYVNAGHNPPCILRTGESGQRGQSGQDGQSDQDGQSGRRRRDRRRGQGGRSAQDGQGRSVQVLRGASGFVLAGLEGMEYTAQETVLQAGDVFFAYTDGVTEAMNSRGGLYGEERLFEKLAQPGDIGAEELVQSVSASLKEFMQEADLADDITMLALRYRPVEEDEEERRASCGKSEEQFCGKVNMEAGADAQKKAHAETVENGTERENYGILRIEARKENLPYVKEFLDRASERYGAGDKLYAVQLMAEEIFVNIASYAYPGGGGTAEICTRREKGRFEVMFSDTGVPYNPLERPDPDITLDASERPVGGLGIYMVKKYADDVAYTYEDGKNIFVFGVNIPS